MASEFRPRLTIRTPLGDLPLGEFEFRMAQGPRVEGNTGDSSWVALYGYIWAVAIINDAVVLLQAVDSSGSPLPIHSSVGSWQVMGTVVIPHSAREIKHIGLAFDQAARPMIAYERNNEVWVRQWDPVSQQFIMRGPFPGVDPVLICDAVVMYKVPDSDVLLFHLSTNRKTLVMRAQRENFANEYVVQTFGPQMILDQTLQYPYRVGLVGSETSQPLSTGFWIASYLYPVDVYDGTIQMSAAPQDALYVITVMRTEQGPDGVQTTATPLDISYVPAIITHSQGDPSIAQLSASPQDGLYTPGVIFYTHQTPDGTQVSATPQDALYALAVIRYTATPEGVQVGATPQDIVYSL